MYGIFGIAAIDCVEEEEICTEFLVFDTPAIMAFKEDNDEGHKFEGKFEWNKITKFATDKMQSFISIVNKNNYESFIQRDPESYKALLFSDKKSPSALIKSLSKTYKGKITFGYVRSTESELFQKFNVQKIPTLLVVTDNDSNEVDVYEGENKLDKFKDFFRPYAYYKEKPTKSNKIGKLSYQIMFPTYSRTNWANVQNRNMKTKFQVDVYDSIQAKRSTNSTYNRDYK